MLRGHDGLVAGGYIVVCVGMHTQSELDSGGANPGLALVEHGMGKRWDAMLAMAAMARRQPRAAGQTTLDQTRPGQVRARLWHGDETSKGAWTARRRSARTAVTHTSQSDDGSCMGFWPRPIRSAAARLACDERGMGWDEMRCHLVSVEKSRIRSWVGVRGPSTSCELDLLVPVLRSLERFNDPGRKGHDGTWSKR